MQLVRWSDQIILFLLLLALINNEKTFLNPLTNFLKRSFSYRGAMAWNQLSNETREMGDLTSFKLAIS